MEKFIEREGRKIEQEFVNGRRVVFRRFPVLFILLTVFGTVAFLHGFELLVDRIPLFYNFPILLIAVGLGVLIFTGSLYKKLSAARKDFEQP